MSGVWGRIVLLGALCASIVLLLAQTQYYATALVLAGIAALIASGLTSRISNLARLAADESGDSRRDRAEAALSRELDHAHALLDTVAGGAVRLEQERVVYLNRAARRSLRPELICSVISRYSR